MLGSTLQARDVPVVRKKREGHESDADHCIYYRDGSGPSRRTSKGPTTGPEGRCFLRLGISKHPPLARCPALIRLDTCVLPAVLL